MTPTPSTTGPTLVEPPSLKTKSLVVGVYGITPKQQRELSTAMMAVIDTIDPVPNIYWKSTYDPAPTSPSTND